MTAVERSEPAIDAAERPMLEGWLDFHRETLAMKCAGLTDAQLREASVPPSAFTLLGLVRHMAEVERGWFREVLAGEDVAPIYGTDEDPDGEFHLTEADTWAEAEATWRAEIAQAREIAAKCGLDDMSVGLSRRHGKPFNLRWIYTHMIEEYARHNGHADLVRERIDGATGA
ncbi:DinB family protein [Streptomyces sp. BE147]|uniref:DinB family protein n=1 Tax=unclassified Streptomyces TaxID=2593676 RepID=UPI002E79503F|nr:DinB family protein [Streptomyces sp. BE147]MEE1736671.1 DinB family protein [Streptomyces sp. BE147]